MYNPNRKIFGFDDSVIQSAETSEKKFMRRPVKFQTAALNEITEAEGFDWSYDHDEQYTKKWSIIHGFDNHGYYRLVIPPDTNLADIERPLGTPNYADYIPPKKAS